MRVLVQHRSGSMWSDFASQFQIFWKVLFNRNKLLPVTLTFSPESVYDQKSDNQHDWRKVIGTKSGWNTWTNHELILVYRYFEGRFQTALYIRKPKKGWEVTDVREHVVVLQPQSTTYVLPLLHRWPVTPYAGGDETNRDTYCFEVRID